MSPLCPVPSSLDETQLRIAADRVLNPLLNCSLQAFYDQMFAVHGVYFIFEPTPFVHPIFSQIFYGILFTLTIFLALMGNFTVMWIILYHRQMRSVTNYYLFNLAVADASISVFNTGFSWSYNYYYVWKFGGFYCRINNLMGITPICASVFTMIVMSIERYYAIIHPLKKRPGRRSTVTIIIMIWLLAFLFGVPAFLASKVDVYYFYDGATLYENPLCLADNFPGGTNSLLGQVPIGAFSEFVAGSENNLITDPNNKLFSYNNGLITVQYILPLCILSAAYYRVGVELRKVLVSFSSLNNR
uniref:G_PROTEIN_RECEP_F1_2 domain-containing protein n=1 Tax=Caenorhabditis japonica TaxID=281687 RepID=A0A8R1DS98_CAEJA